MEPQMRKLRYLLKDRLHIKYVMGGLIRDWMHYSDQMNNVSQPSQLGPLWMEAKYKTGQPMHEFLWVEEPVESSYPACLAVKAAEMQSPMAGEAMLRKLREAVMIHQQDISRDEVILKVAAVLAEKGVLDQYKFEEKRLSQEASDFFRKDLEKIKIKGVTRFPTLLISNGDRTIQITGYRPFSVLADAFKNLNPQLELNLEIDRAEYINSWEKLTERELQEIGAKEEEYSGI